MNRRRRDWVGLFALLGLFLAGCVDNRGYRRDPTRVEEVELGPALRPVESPVVVPEGDEAYASIRIVRQREGELSRPEILLPPGYTLYADGYYGVASPGEFYTFIGGPKGTAEGVRIRWPNVLIADVIHGDAHLEMRREADAVAVDVPVTAPTARAAWNTLEVWSHLNEKDLPIRIEHNDPRRRAGEYARVPWVEGQAQAALNYIFAARQILRDWGIHHTIADEKAGRLSLMGFETNNPLHGDYPPHWHLIYYWPGEDGKASSNAAGSQIPHFYMDSRGRVVENKVDVFGNPPRSERLRVGQPMVYTDPGGRVRMAVEIRPDGGLNIGPEVGRWKYQIVEGGDGADFRRSVRVLRDGRPWVRVAADDDTEEGVLTVRVRPLSEEGQAATEVYPYDPATGVISPTESGSPKLETRNPNE